ncbi:MAG: aminoglycoside phosphotransferase family protein, partial [Anaerolineae bacterium]|nr:aminoglycoside phosphotransferase family protein [Anaerolineae bacterium]
TRRLFLKQIPPEDALGENELRINQALQGTACFPAPRLLFTAAGAQGTLAGWEWAPGSDLRERQAGALPRAFAELGRFHAVHRIAKPVCSPTTREPYPSVPSMLRAELALLTSGLEPAVIAGCAAAFRRLEAGYVTCIHGDFHPGNIRLTPAGPQFVDWGYATTSLNLFDLSYVQCFVNRESDAAEWWQITPRESPAVLEAYFATCGMGDLEWQPLQWAVEVWTALYGYHNARLREDAAGSADSLGALAGLLENSRELALGAI